LAEVEQVVVYIPKALLVLTQYFLQLHLQVVAVVLEAEHLLLVVLVVALVHLMLEMVALEILVDLRQ
jgi:hypothetical protein